MFEIKKTFIVSIAHNLELTYESKCNRLHGHDLEIAVYCSSHELNENSMVVDFTAIKKLVSDKLDHAYLNEIEGVGYVVEESKSTVAGRVESEPKKRSLNPTAEMLASWICEQVNSFLVTDNPQALCFRVDVQETEGNLAIYTVDR